MNVKLEGDGFDSGLEVDVTAMDVGTIGVVVQPHLTVGYVASLPSLVEMAFLLDSRWSHEVVTHLRLLL